MAKATFLVRKFRDPILLRNHEVERPEEKNHIASEAHGKGGSRSFKIFNDGRYVVVADRKGQITGNPGLEFARLTQDN